MGTLEGSAQIKTILVPALGTDGDEAVFETAFAAALPSRAHLDFLHVRIGPGEAARYLPHADLAEGAGLRVTIDRLRKEAETRAAEARRRFDEFRGRRSIATDGTPGQTDGVSVSWREEIGEALPYFVHQARRHDLVVIGRYSSRIGIPADFAERLLLGGGRPLLIAPSRAPAALTGPAVICWKESPEAARAITAAMPLLTQTQSVVIVAVDEDESASRAELADLVDQLRWHRIDARAEIIATNWRSIPEVLRSVAEQCGADLLVAGGYGHSRVRELVFGGVTRSLLADAKIPVLLFH